MLGHIPMDHPSRADVEHDEHIEDTEACGHRDEEITGQDRVRVIPNKRRPALGRPTAAGRPHVPEIPSDRARRDRQPELQEQFIRDPLLAPGRVCPCHGHDQPPQVDRNRWPAGPGLPPPEEPPALAVPPNERVRLDDCEHRAPVKQSGQQDERDSRGRVGPPRLRAPLLVQRQLFAQEQVFRRQMHSGHRPQPGKRDEVTQ